jgi:hypothetical protein
MNYDENLSSLQEEAKIAFGLMMRANFTKNLFEPCEDDILLLKQFSNLIKALNEGDLDHFANVLCFKNMLKLNEGEMKLAIDEKTPFFILKTRI